MTAKYLLLWNSDISLFRLKTFVISFGLNARFLFFPISATLPSIKALSILSSRSCSGANSSLLTYSKILALSHFAPASRSSKLNPYTKSLPFKALNSNTAAYLTANLCVDATSTIGSNVTSTFTKHIALNL